LGLVFLGANQDAVLTGSRLSFDADRSMTLDAAPVAVEAMSASLSRYVGDVRRKSKRGFTPGERGGSAPAGDDR
jgi:hypothetical protein